MNSKLYIMLEKKLSKYAIPNISLYLLMCYGVGYIITFINPTFLNYLTLEPTIIMRGQIWRLFTWIIVPPSSSNFIFVMITLYFYYSIGNTLERVWGTFKYNLYLLSGMLFTLLGSFILYFIFISMGKHIFLGGAFSSYYINMSIFLAFATTFPDMQVLLMFIIPVKVKWLGFIYGATLLYEALTGGVISWFVIGASIFNFIVFYFTYRNSVRLSVKDIKRKREFKRATYSSTKQRVAKHKCAVCGRTSEEYPDLEFRFCSKCDGNYEYCSEHLFSHEHYKVDK